MSAGGLAYVSGGGGGNDVSITGNTAGVPALISSGTLYLAGGNNVTLSQNGQSITISGANAGGAQTGISGIIVSNTTYTSGTVSFSNANGITFGSSAGQAITASYNSTQFAGTGSSITGNASLTINSAGLAFNGSGLAGTSTGATNISVTLNSSGIAISGPVETGIGLSASNASASAGVVTLSNSNNVSFGMAASVVTATASYPTTQAVYFVGNTVGQSSSSTVGDQTFSYTYGGAVSGGWSGGSLLISAPATSSMVGSNAITLSTNGSTISVVGQPYLTRYIVPYDNALTVVSAPGNASASFQYVPVMGAVTGSRIDALASWSAMGSSATTNTAAIAISAYAAIYTRNVSTLSSLSSGSTQTTYSYASNTAGHTEFLTAAMRPISCPVNFNMLPGEYIVGFNIVTATSSIGASTTSFGLTLSMMGGNQLQTAANYAEIGSQTATSSNLVAGMGVYASATTGMPAAASLSAIAQTGSSLSQANIALVFRNA
jgi:hypothetical protein